MAEEVLRLGVDPTGAEQGFRRYARAAEDAGVATGKVDRSVNQLGRAVADTAKVIAASYFLREVIRNSVDAQNKMAQLEAVVKSTGGVAGKTVQDLDRMAAALQRTTNYSDEATKGAQALLLTFKQIRGDNFDAATRATLDLAQAMGTDLRSAALQVGKALEDPATQMTYLRRSGVSFTTEQVALAKQLQATGDLAGAQAIVLRELESQFGGSAAAARDTLGGALIYISNQWADALEVSRSASGGMIDALNAIGNAIPEVRSTLDEFLGGIQLLAVDAAVAIGEVQLAIARLNATTVGGTLANLTGLGEGRGPFDMLNLIDITGGNRSVEDATRNLENLRTAADEVRRAMFQSSDAVKAFEKAQEEAADNAIDFEEQIRRLNASLLSNLTATADVRTEQERWNDKVATARELAERYATATRSVAEVTGNSATMLAHVNEQVEAVVQAWAAADFSQQGALDSLRAVNEILAQSGTEFGQLLPLLQAYIERMQAATGATAAFSAEGVDLRGGLGSLAGGIGGVGGSVLAGIASGGTSELVRGLTSALGSVLGGLFGSRAEDEARWQAQRDAVERQQRAAEDFARAVEAFATAVGGTPSSLSADVERILGMTPAEAAARMREIEAAIEEAQRTLDTYDERDERYAQLREQAKRDLERLNEEYDKLNDVMAAHQRRLDELRESYMEELNVRRLIALGAEEDAAKLRMSLQQQREYADAVAAGWDEAALAQLDVVQGMEMARFMRDLADAAREAAEAAEQAAQRERELAAERRQAEAEAFRVLGEDLTVRAMALSGRGTAAERASLLAQQRRELAGVAGQPQEVMDLYGLIHTLERSALEDSQAMAAIQAAAENQVASLDAQYAAIQDQASAQQEQASIAREHLTVARDSLRAQERAVAETRRAYESLATFASGLPLGSYTPLSRTAQLREARSQFQAIASQALAGDAGAAGDLSGVAQTYLGALRGVYASSSAYATGFAEVQGIIAAVRDRFGAQLSVEERILNELQGQTAQMESQIASLTDQSGTMRAQLDAVRAAQDAARASAQAQIDAIQADALIRQTQMQSQIDALLEQLAVLQAIKDSNEQIADAGGTQPTWPPLPDDWREWSDSLIQATDQGGGSIVDFRIDDELLDPLLAEQRATVTVLSSGFTNTVARLGALEAKIEQLTNTNRNGFESLQGAGPWRDW